MKKSCVIIGGGVIGMMTAFELAYRDWDVSIIEKNECGKESSWAGSGILSPLYPWNEHEAVHALTVFGQEQYPQLSNQLIQNTGIDPECVVSGMLYIKPNDQPRVKEWLDIRSVPYLEQESGFQNQKVPCIFLPHTMQIRNPRLGKAIRSLLLNRGVTVLEHESIIQLSMANNRVQSIETDRRTIGSDVFVFASGAWTKEILKPLGYAVDVKPVKGQVIGIQTPPGLLQTMMMYDSRYIIPRNDGLVLVGSTVEDVGFNKESTEVVKAELMEEAYQMCPQLRGYRVVHHWAGLRPGTNRSVPYICQLPDCENAYVSAGHFRYGLTLAPASARLLVDLIEDKEPLFDVDAFQWS